MAAVLDHRSPHAVVHEEIDGRAVERRFSQHERDGVHVVEAKLDYGTYTWWIDPRRGDSIVRSTVADESGVVFETRTTVRQHGDFWFPEMVSIYRRDHEDGQSPAEIIQVLSAEFNHSDHPRRFTPKDLGIEAGVNVRTYDGFGRRTELKMFDGEAAVDPDEYLRRRRSGDVEPGETVKRLYAEARAQREKWEQETGLTLEQMYPERFPHSLQFRTRHESAWERYTRAFIERYALDAEQAQQAWSICEDCQERARAYLDSRKQKLDELQREMTAAGTGDAARDMRRRQDAVARLSEQLKPIDEIFEKQLKPRLDRIPTRAQRETAKATTQPASRPGRP